MSYKEVITNNIKSHGWHIYVVQQGECPRYAYTIGLTNRVGFELVAPGLVLLEIDDLVLVINHLASFALSMEMGGVYEKCNVPGVGYFSLKSADSSWGERLLIGAESYYNHAVAGKQIFPEQHTYTVDTPDLELPFDASSQQAWRWLDEPWSLPIPPSSVVTTDVRALLGRRIVEASRWEDSLWEMFSEEDIRVVPFSVLLSADSTIEKTMSLRIGESLRRNIHADGKQDWVNL